jgi:hypothetical protein
MAENKLRSILQGMSNAAASNVSAPVDGIAWLLRKAGIPMPSNPLGGSDWMEQQGLTAKPQNAISGLLGESLGGVAPIVAAAKAPQIAKGLLQGAENLAAPRTMNPQTGAIVLRSFPVEQLDNTIVSDEAYAQMKQWDQVVPRQQRIAYEMEMRKAYEDLYGNIDSFGLPAQRLSRELMRNSRQPVRVAFGEAIKNNLPVTRLFTNSGKYIGKP